jgi:hypothetical protein
LYRADYNNRFIDNLYEKVYSAAFYLIIFVPHFMQNWLSVSMGAPQRRQKFILSGAVFALWGSGFISRADFLEGSVLPTVYDGG